MLQPIQTKQLSADGYQLNQHSPRVVTITNELTHFTRLAYFAFDGWSEAHAFWKSITDKQVCSRAQVKENERFTSYSWEVKVWSMPQSVLEQLIERDFNRYLPKALPVTPIRRDWSNSTSHNVIQYEAA